MNIRNTYLTTLLSLLLSFSLAVPFCFHADTMDSTAAHHQQMASHDSQEQPPDAHQCECGHEFVKDYQKNKVISDESRVLSPSLVLSVYQNIYSENNFLSAVSSWRARITDRAGPALHLFIGVFLN